jgi:PAS domain S-box-containing protein
MGVQLPSANHAERALADSEIRLQQVLDNSTAMVFAKDRRGRYLFVNREFERVTARPAAQMLGRTDDEVFPPELATRFRHNDLRVLQEGRGFEFEEAADFGGGTRVFMSSKFPLLDSDGAAYAVCGMATDITERKRMEEAFSAAALAVSQSEEETLYRQLVRYLCAILGVDGAFIATPAPDDSGALRMLAFHLDGEVRENFSYPLTGTPCETVVGQCFRLYPARLVELFPLDPDFRALGFDCYAGHPLADASGAPLGLIAVVSRRPFRDPALVEATLRIFAVRVNAELERAAAAAALRGSEAQYRAIFNASADAMVLWDSQFRRVDVNPAFERLYGWTREEVIGRGFDFPEFSPDHTKLRQELIRHALAGEVHQAEHDVVCKDGRRIRAEVQAVPFHHNGEPHVLVIGRDITERTRAEETLRASEEQHRAVFNATSDAMILWDSQVRRVDVNTAYERAFGWSRDEVLKEGCGCPPEHAVPREDMVRRALAGEVCHAEIESVRRDGAHVLLEVSALPFRHRGEPHVLAVARDITARKQAEEALRASEEQYRTIFNASIDALLLKNEDHHIVDVNAAYLTMHGFRREDVVGHHLSEFIPDELQEQCNQLLPGILAGQPCRLEAQTRRSDGRLLDVEINGVPMMYRGRPHALVMMRDLTEQKRAAAAHAELEGRLRQAQKMEAIGQLTGGIAHDFNNLLTSIMGYVVLASERDSALGDRRLAGYLAQAQRSCERARDLIQQMLMFSRGQRGSPRAVSLASVVRGALPTLQAGLPDTLELEVVADDSAAPVFVDPSQVEQVLLNLCINARDATGGVGRLRIEVRPLRDGNLVCTGCREVSEGEFVELSVADDGHGIAPDLIDRIFEPFFSTKEAGKGSGMGLAMVHGIVHEHGGHVIVESSPGRGARFRVVWPVADGLRRSMPDEAERDAPARPSRPSLSGSVLVVDDDETVGQFMREMLETWGLQVTWTPRPEAALELVRATPSRFDVVITDQSMPKLTGLQLSRRLREVRADLPVVLYTGHGEGLADGDAAGLSAVIRKPVDPVLLSRTLSGCLAPVAMASSSIHPVV